MSEEEGEEGTKGEEQQEPSMEDILSFCLLIVSCITPICLALILFTFLEEKLERNLPIVSLI